MKKLSNDKKQKGILRGLIRNGLIFNAEKY